MVLVELVVSYLELNASSDQSDQGHLGSTPIKLGLVAISFYVNERKWEDLKTDNHS